MRPTLRCAMSSALSVENVDVEYRIGPKLLKTKLVAILVSPGQVVSSDESSSLSGPESTTITSSSLDAVAIVLSAVLGSPAPVWTGYDRNRAFPKKKLSTDTSTFYRGAINRRGTRGRAGTERGAEPATMQIGDMIDKASTISAAVFCQMADAGVDNGVIAHFRTLMNAFIRNRIRTAMKVPDHMDRLLGDIVMLSISSGILIQPRTANKRREMAMLAARVFNVPLPLMAGSTPVQCTGPRMRTAEINQFERATYFVSGSCTYDAILLWEDIVDVAAYLRPFHGSMVTPPQGIRAEYAGRGRCPHNKKEVVPDWHRKIGIEHPGTSVVC